MSEQSLLVRNGRIYTPDGILKQGNMLVHPDGTITAISEQMPDVPEGTRVIELDGKSIIPGLIDVHIHGGNGFGVMNGTYRDLDEVSWFHARHGTTAFLATTGSAPDKEGIISVLRCTAQAIRQGVSGAEIAGIHLEGPFINEKRKGAFISSELHLPNRREIELYLDAAEGHLRMVTLAPELPGGYDAVRLFRERGVTVSVGHSDATYAEMIEAVKLGATHTTHHFNGMRPLNHREPGVAGAGLMLPELTTELIADGIHVHPAVAKLLFDTKGVSNVCVITDAVHCAGLPDGEYGRQSLVNGVIYLRGTDTLAGSTLTMIQALKNVIRFTGYSLEKILPSLTSVPARQIGLGSRKGSLDIGKDADFLITDEALSIHATFVKGREVYHA